MIGNMVADRYEILAELGQGGFGEVYRARDRDLGREVALKLVLDDTHQDGIQPSIRQEAGMLAQFRHPGIVTVHDFGEHEGRLFLVMELVDGTPLSQIIAQEPTDLETTLAVARLVSAALGYAHDKGIIHRDLALDNIMVENTDGELSLKILDFGLGKMSVDAMDGLDGKQMGTPRYMPPELMRGMPANEKSDVYSFAVCLYRLINGRFPFEGEHMAALEYSVQYEEAPGFSAAAPADLEKLVMQCLDKMPANRPTGFAEILSRLELIEVDSGESVSAVESKTATGGNPYLNRVMISDPADFIGRRKEVTKIYSRLDAPQPQSISVVGDRRIGKSSLLNFIFNEGNRKRHMSQADRSVFVFMDFQSDIAFETDRFLGLLMDRLPASCKGRSGGGGDPTFSDLENAVANLDGQGKRLLVLMDEFERITNNAKFEQSFFSFLRSLANRYKVAYVTSSFAELQELCHTREISDSPFFNIFSNLPLGPFLPDEAVDLVKTPSAREGFPLEAHVGRLVKYAGLRPMHLQIACSCLFEVVSVGDGEVVDWQEFEKNFLEEICPHFEFVWNRLGEQERANLVQLARDKPVNRQQAHVNEELKRRGLIVMNDGKTRIESESFRTYVLGRGGDSGGSFLNKIFKRGR